LDESAKYLLDYFYDGTRRTMSGKELMNRGLIAPYRRGDVAPTVIHLRKEGDERL
jgi:hypothetical protein